MARIFRSSLCIQNHGSVPEFSNGDPRPRIQSPERRQCAAAESGQAASVCRARAIIEERAP